LLVDMAVWLSPSSPELAGAARAAAEVPRQIANANTLFNVINTLLFIGFTGWFARLAERLIAERAPAAGIIVEPEFLTDAALAVPSVALQQVRLELGRIGAITLGMLQDIGPALKNRNLQPVEDIARRDDQVDILEAAILVYLGKIRKGMLSEQESSEFQGLMTATNDIEALADVIETDMVALARKAASVKSRSDDETLTMLETFHSTITRSVELAVQAVRDNDQRAAESVLMMKSTIQQQSEQMLGRKASRLATEDPDYLNLVRLQMSFIDHMRRIYTLAKRIAKVALPAVLAQRE
jgi:phosphate:Na+ symporter